MYQYPTLRQGAKCANTPKLYTTHEDCSFSQKYITWQSSTKSKGNRSQHLSSDFCRKISFLWLIIQNKWNQIILPTAGLRFLVMSTANELSKSFNCTYLAIQVLMKITPMNPFKLIKEMNVRMFWIIWITEINGNGLVFVHLNINSVCNRIK